MTFGSRYAVMPSRGLSGDQMIISQENLEGRKVLITGARGFIGSALCRALADSGAEIIGVSRNIPELKGAARRWYATDCAEETSVNSLFAETRPDIVVHLATAGPNIKSLDTVPANLRDDLISTVYVLTAAAKYGVARSIITASLEEPVDSRDSPMSSYAAAKVAGGIYGRLFRTVFEHPVVILRPFMGYGPGQPPAKFVAAAVRSCLEGKPIRMGAGRKQTEWIYIDDIASAFVSAMKVTNPPKSTLDIGTGVTHSVREVAEMIVRLMPGVPQPEFGVLTDRPTDDVVRAADIETTAQEIGWRAKTPLEAGLRMTIAKATDTYLAA